MKDKILVTGSEGLVGRSLRLSLEALGNEVVGFDLKGSGVEQGDVCNSWRVHRAVSNCDGIVHLAAVSRVLFGEINPDLCRKTNIRGPRNIIEASARSKRRPWILFVSSREVYGQPKALPVTEDCELKPINVYGHTKVEGERLVVAARKLGLRTAVVRLSNVYGSTMDHLDRVIPAFARTALLGGELRVDGSESVFDFTHINDVTHGISAIVNVLSCSTVDLPPIHLLTGRPTTLGELAEMAIVSARSNSKIVESPPRTYDVARFYGDYSRATKLLGWKPQTSIEQGINRLIECYRTELSGLYTDYGKA